MSLKPIHTFKVLDTGRGIDSDGIQCLPNGVHVPQWVLNIAGNGQTPWLMTDHYGNQWYSWESKGPGLSSYYSYDGGPHIAARSIRVSNIIDPDPFFNIEFVEEIDDAIEVFFAWSFTRSGLQHLVSGTPRTLLAIDEGTLESTLNVTKVTTTDDIEITDIGSGPILKSPNGSRFRVTVTDGGVLGTTAL